MVTGVWVVLFALALVFALVFDAAAFFRAPAGQVRLRLERRRIVLKGERFPTTDLQRVEVGEGALRLVRIDGRCDILELPLEDAYLLEVLAEILRESAARDGTASSIPSPLHRLRQRDG
jgi:hypothetical protein